MNINNVQITPNQADYAKNDSVKHNQIAFQGAQGDKFVSEVIKGENVTPKSILKEIKGAFGIKTEKFEDIMESFIEKVKSLYDENSKLSEYLKNAHKKIDKFPEEQQELKNKTDAEVREYFNKIVDAKNKELANAKAEAKEAKAEAKEAKEAFEKYKPVVNIKSIEEIGTVLPEKVIETAKEMAEHRVDATKSMYDFLMTGKGQEEVLNQLNRNSIIQKAKHDGIFDIDYVDEEISNIARENKMYLGVESRDLALRLIEDALKSTPKGSCIASHTIQEQVKKNAMALLTPLADNQYYNTNIQATEEELDKILKSSVNFHKYLKKGLEVLEKEFGKENVVFNQVDFDLNKSCITFPEGLSTRDANLQDFANWAVYY